MASDRDESRQLAAAEASSESSASKDSSRLRPRPSSLEGVLADCLEVLERDGIHAALGFLNGRVRYRFTGVYRFDPPVLRNVDLYDRENPSLCFSGSELVLRDSYCGIVQLTERPFVTTDATRDERLNGYAARVSMVSYLGVPLRLRGGALFGTLCHWDGRPRLAPTGEVELLERLAPLLVSSLAGSAPIS